MKKITSILIFIILFIFSNAQNDKEAKTYFSKYLNSKNYMTEWAKELPTLEECKAVFKGVNADTCYQYIEAMKDKMMKNNTGPVFVDLYITSYTTADIIEGKSTGSMKAIGNRLQNNVTFYKIEFLKTSGAEGGVAFNYWVKINNKWVFFPKPWRAFKE